ncbi:filaggrin isoform X1 [Drosophila miranda]|uniref:filaggrin isoform X1 n=1 Tax=Drosophila miranda TaxID=7229 RepID=UPI0007E65DC9|nr:filaggrin isoform X1 [Drosophila miranda]
MNCLCRPSRIMSVRINLLDETEFIHEIKDDLPGQALLDVVFARLNLIETSYFGIRYIDEENQTHWLDPASRISRQLKPKSDPYDLYFGVKFYAADPCKLLEEITRYQLFLQVKQDVLQGRLPVAFELAAELGAFVVQSELGDYDQRRHSKGYVSEFRLLPNQSNELETRVSELHQQLKGMSPSSAELNYLDKVKWHDMYGVDLHPVLGEDSVEYFLGLTPSGIVVLRNKTTVAHYYWPRIAKVYYKGRYFMLRISDKNNELSTYGFETPRKSACKHLWRCCVEHHAFFRQVRVAPLPSSQSHATDLFQLGSRFRHSRPDKQTEKDALAAGRSPPAFTRVPSKRQPRRVIDDFFNSHKGGGTNGAGGGAGAGGGGALLGGVVGNGGVVSGAGGGINMGNRPLPQPGLGNISNNYDSPYRSTYSIPTSLGIRPCHQQSPQQQQQQQQNNNSSSYNNNSGGNLQTPDSPRSTRSAPWPRSQQRSLFGHTPSSPRSVRSASTAHHHHHHGHHSHGHGTSHHPHQQSSSSSHHQRQQRASSSSASHQQQRYRSSSVESHSSNDSRSTRRHKHRHRRTSDNESELSRGSGRSGRSGRSHHRKHRRSHRHRRDSAGGSDHDSTRGRSYSGHRSSSMRSGSAELIDSTTQWREVQRRQAEASLGQSSVQQAAVSKSSMVARSLHSNDSHSDTHSHHKSRRHRKNKSPSESRSRMWNSELAKHLQFDLVDTEGMSEQQLREIPYTVVETTSKRSNSNLKIHKSNSKSSVGAKSTGSGNTITNGSGSASAGQARIRVDRIRGLYYQSSHPHEGNGGGAGAGGNAPKNGSIRSASTISSRECERNNGLVRMMSSMSMGDFISPTGSNLSPLENSALRVSHEHTDSGLGADQDYAYSSERSSDSTRYGTNKSSGASSGSHRKSGGSAGGGTNGGYNSLMQQTVSNQQQQQRSLFAQQQRQQQQQQQQKTNYKYASSSSTTNPTSAGAGGLAPVHNASSSSGHGHTTPNTNPNSNPNPQTNATNPMQSPAAGHANRLLHYTTFENNQYKFSLNNALARGSGMGSGSMAGAGVATGGGSSSNLMVSTGGGGAGGGGGAFSRQRSFVEWPSNPAAPYYYQGPSTSAAQVKRRDAKSDIGVPTRRLSGQSITKTQLLTGGGGGGQLANASCYPLHYASSSVTSSGHSRPPGQRSGQATASGRYGMQPAKSDLFLSYIHGAEYERPYIYNYKMPQMPAGSGPGAGSGSGAAAAAGAGGVPGGSPKQQPTAYHISGSQTADPPPPPPPLYGGSAPANDVMYYQFDKGAAPSTSTPPIVQQPQSIQSMQSMASRQPSSSSSSVAGGPLVYLQHGQNVAPSNVTSTQQTIRTHSSSHSCSEEDEAMMVLEAMQQDAAQTTNDETEDTDDIYDDEAAEAEDMFDADAPLMSPTGSHNSTNNNTCNNNAINNNNNGRQCHTVPAVAGTQAGNINFDNCNANVYNGQHQQQQLGPITTADQTLNCPTQNANTNTNMNTNVKSSSNTNPTTNTSTIANVPTSDPPSNVAAPSTSTTTTTAAATAAAAAASSTTTTLTNFHSNLQQNQNISSSLEIILSPIIQSSRRAQFQSPPPPTTTYLPWQ